MAFAYSTYASLSQILKGGACPSLRPSLCGAKATPFFKGRFGWPVGQRKHSSPVRGCCWLPVNWE
eukprot:2984097-Amphidinium_carterae.1